LVFGDWAVGEKNYKAENGESGDPDRASGGITDKRVSKNPTSVATPTVVCRGEVGRLPALSAHHVV